MRKFILYILVLFFSSFQAYAQSSEKMRGLSVAAPPDEFTENPMPEMLGINADWIAVIPFGFQKINDPHIKYNLEFQWWGETKAGVIRTITDAHDAGLKVMLKPQIYIPGSWVGEEDYATEEEWKIWEEGYRKFITFFLDIAIEYDVELFCIGTEQKVSIQKRTAFWKELISDARCKYGGSLTYSGNWDAYEIVPFWDDLDYIGLSAYFPLSEDKTPSRRSLLKLWKPKVAELKAFANKFNKKMIFTEYGYMTVDGCAGKAWEIEKMREQLSLNEQAQANAYGALLESFWDQDFWAGGFMWKWFPNMQGHEGYPEKDYTPQGKKSHDTIKEWYGKKS